MVVCKADLLVRVIFCGQTVAIHLRKVVLGRTVTEEVRAELLQLALTQLVFVFVSTQIGKNLLV